MAWICHESPNSTERYRKSTLLYAIVMLIDHLHQVREGIAWD